MLPPNSVGSLWDWDAYKFVFWFGLQRLNPDEKPRIATRLSQGCRKVVAIRLQSDCGATLQHTLEFQEICLRPQGFGVTLWCTAAPGKPPRALAGFRLQHPETLALGR